MADLGLDARPIGLDKSTRDDEGLGCRIYFGFRVGLVANLNLCIDVRRAKTG